MRSAAALVAAALTIAACGTIEPVPLSSAPVNTCAAQCDRFEPSAGTGVKAQCSAERRCTFPGQPSYPYVIVVNVPTTSLYAPGHTFVLPAVSSDPPTRDRCVPPDCRTLPPLGNITGQYRVTAGASVLAGYPLPDNTSLPVRATYVPVGRTAQDVYDPSIPVDVLFASSRFLEDRGEVSYARSLPSGRWLRVFEPQPPFDAYFPPRLDERVLVRGGTDDDFFQLGGATGALDDPGGPSREAVVRRAEGLDGFTVWLRDQVTGRRISTVRTLSGTEARPRLATTGRGTSLENVDAVVAPPPGFLAIPRLETPLIGGTGLQSLDYPPLPEPIALEGLVAAADEDGGVLTAVASRLAFTSVSILLRNGDAQPLLKYTTTVSTDDRGRFATVLPPGTYDVTVEPLEGTGRASFRQQVVVADAEPITLSPPPRTLVRGVAMLSDGRLLTAAEVLATPEPVRAGAAPSARARRRAGRTRTDGTGTFALELDQGRYVLTVIPQEGTGFPRLVTRHTIPPDSIDLGTLRVPAPIRVRLTFREPVRAVDPIIGARVRIFANPGGGATGPALELGAGTTDEKGQVEILLAEPPP